MTTVYQQIGPYEIDREIGRGGMAVVFLATDSRNGRQVALKLVPVGDDREGRDVLDAERNGARLQEQVCQVSRHVPVVYEQDAVDGYFYIAMEYVDGRNLSDLIADGPLPANRAITIAAQLCSFLEAAHAFEATIEGRPLRSLLHGDLKPRNVRVMDGDVVKVLDFGIAKALSLSRKVTRNDFGSVAYLSPERLDSGEIDGHADFWAVGVLLYEMVAGVQPFRASDTRRLEQRIRSLRPAEPLDAGCPPGLQAIVAKLLTGNREDRYDHAGAIREDLECVLSGRPTQAEREGWPNRSQDEPATRRTSGRAAAADEEATRRTSPTQGTLLSQDTLELPPPATGAGDALQCSARPTPEGSTPLTPEGSSRPSKKGASRFRRVKAGLLLLALLIVGNEIRVALRAEQLEVAVPTLELDRVGDVWGQFEGLKSRSLGIGVMGLEGALASQTARLADRVFGNYRMPVPSVREKQWRMAREALVHAVAVARGDRRLKAALRYCDGHLHRINGEALKSRRQTASAQNEFTNAVAAFREAAELRPDWADPFLGLMRTFIYGLEDVDRGADALKQAQRFGYTAGDRETAQLADGYRTRGDAFAHTARALSGMAQELEYLNRAAEAYRQALDQYAKIVGFAGAPRNMRAVQRELSKVEQRIAELARSVVTTPATQPAAAPPRSSRARRDSMALRWA